MGVGFCTALACVQGSAALGLGICDTIMLHCGSGSFCNSCSSLHKGRLPKDYGVNECVDLECVVCEDRKKPLKSLNDSMYGAVRVISVADKVMPTIVLDVD